MAKIYRYLRILEYVGDREFIDNSIAQRGVKGSHIFGSNVIREAVLGDVVEDVTFRFPPAEQIKINRENKDG